MQCVYTMAAAEVKKEEYLYSVIYTTHSLIALDIDQTVLPANYTVPVFPS